MMRSKALRERLLLRAALTRVLSAGVICLYESIGTPVPLKVSGGEWALLNGAAAAHTSLPPKDGPRCQPCRAGCSRCLRA